MLFDQRNGVAETSRARHQLSRYSKSYDSQVSFDEQFQGYLEKFMLAVKHDCDLDSFDKIVILDDGGHLLTFAKDFFDSHQKIVGIEQTSSGFEAIKDANLPFPVINVARSRAKLKYESPFIAEVVVDRVLEYFAAAKLEHPNVLVVGQGAIGSAITSLLQATHVVEVHDVKNGTSVDYDEYDVIIGATGKTVLAPSDFQRLKKPVHLISASSSNREFSAVYLRRMASHAKDCHADVAIDSIHLVNAGFPINFDGRINSMLPEHAQLTRSLLFAAVMEAQTHDLARGLHDISELQNSITKKFVELTNSD